MKKRMKRMRTRMKKVITYLVAFTAGLKKTAEAVNAAEGEEDFEERLEGELLLGKNADGENRSSRQTLRYRGLK